LSNTAVDHLRFVPQSGNRLGQFILQFIQIVTAHILEFDLFEILPDSLDEVQIGCVACLSLDVDVSGGTLRQKGFDFAIVNWAPSHTTNSFVPICRWSCLRKPTTSARVNARACPRTCTWPSGVMAPISDR
jgi:hypothetical protein